MLAIDIAEELHSAFDMLNKHASCQQSTEVVDWLEERILQEGIDEIRDRRCKSCSCFRKLHVAVVVREKGNASPVGEAFLGWQDNPAISRLCWT